MQLKAGTFTRFRARHAGGGCEGHLPTGTSSAARTSEAPSSLPKRERSFQFKVTSTYEGGIKSIKSDHSTCLNQQARKRKPKPLRVCGVSGWSACSASRITLSEIIMLLSSPSSQRGALRGAETEDRFSSAVSLILTHLKGTIMFNRTRSAQASDFEEPSTRCGWSSPAVPRCCALFVCFPPRRRDPRGVIPREKESPPPAPRSRFHVLGHPCTVGSPWDL